VRPAGEGGAEHENGVVGDGDRGHHEQQDHDYAVTHGYPEAFRDSRSPFRFGQVRPADPQEDHGEDRERERVAKEGPSVADPVHQCDAQQRGDRTAEIVGDRVHDEGWLDLGVLSGQAAYRDVASWQGERKAEPAQQRADPQPPSVEFTREFKEAQDGRD
jgi:hypothetical protein